MLREDEREVAILLPSGREKVFARRDVESLKQLHSSPMPEGLIDDLTIEDEMLLWTPVEARRYFETRGAQRPDPAVMSGRKPTDKVSHDRTGPRRNRRELLLGCLCPCLAA